jgi:hypothetical protein
MNLMWQKTAKNKIVIEEEQNVQKVFLTNNSYFIILYKENSENFNFTYFMHI